MVIRVRAAVVDDAEAVAAAHVAAWQGAYRGLMPATYLEGLDVAERAAGWRRGLARDHDPVLVAESDGRVVGFAVVGPNRDEEPEGAGELRALNVEPGAWGTGAGTALLDAAHTTLGELGFASSVLWVLPGNERARRFYEREGWQHDGASRVAEVMGVTVPEVRYRRALR